MTGKAAPSFPVTRAFVAWGWGGFGPGFGPWGGGGWYGGAPAVVTTGCEATFQLSPTDTVAAFTLRGDACG